jgi:DNA sulfur modification protein DndB
MFADLNRYAVRPSRSLGILYDHRDDRAELVRRVVVGSPLFRDMVEMEKSTLSPRSRRLFTFSAIYSATNALLANMEALPFADRIQMATAHWEEVAKGIPEWEFVRARKLTAGELREDFIHSHGVVLHGLGRVGNTLMHHYAKDWKKRLSKLKDIDWSRSNARVWEGRAMIAGRVSKSFHNVVLTGNAIKQHLGLALTPEEERVEEAFRRGDYDREAAKSGTKPATQAFGQR